MPHYIAFLRGINLGKRRIKMDALRILFIELNFSEVETFIASGNVIFSSKSTDSKKLEIQIETHLEKSLGYAVDTFVRTREHVSAISVLQPFAVADLECPSNTLHIGFLKNALSPAQARQFLACRTTTDELSLSASEYYWLCRTKSHESKMWSSARMKAVKLPSSSMRNITTIRKLAALYRVPAI